VNVRACACVCLVWMAGVDGGVPDSESFEKRLDRREEERATSAARYSALPATLWRRYRTLPRAAIPNRRGAGPRGRQARWLATLARLGWAAAFPSRPGGAGSPRTASPRARPRSLGSFEARGCRPVRGWARGRAAREEVSRVKLTFKFLFAESMSAMALAPCQKRRRKDFVTYCASKVPSTIR
jgi:hypothetical protein